MAQHPLRVATDTVDPNLTDGGITETLYDALQKRVGLWLAPTESLADLSFDAGSVPLGIYYGKTGYAYFYSADDTTSEDDGLTVLVSGDGKRYILADASAIAISSILAITNDPPDEPSEGDAYIVGPAPTGAFVGHGKDIALRTPRGWVFATPKPGCALLNEATGLNIQYSAAGVWGAMATSLEVATVNPELMLFAMGLSVEAQQNDPPGAIVVGKYYLAGLAPTGGWSGKANKVPYSPDGTTWSFLDPYDGARIFNKATDGELVWFDATGSWKPITPINQLTQGRLTLESGVPVSTADQAAKATLYFTPFGGNAIGLYVGGAWVLRTFAELSLSLSGYTSAKPFDIFAYDNAGAVAIESLVWTNDTTRATAIAYQDGIAVKSGDPTRKLVGTIYTSATGQCSDTLLKRFVSNLYNRRSRPLLVAGSGTWGGVSGTTRQAAGSTANQVEAVNCIDLDEATATAILAASTSAGGVISTGVAIDSTTTYSGLVGTAPAGTSGQTLSAVGAWRGYLGIGRHLVVWMESASSANITFAGSGTTTKSGLTASVVG